MIIGIGKRKQEQLSSKKPPYMGELGGFVMADAMRNRRVPSVTMPKQNHDVELPRRKLGKPMSKPELGGFAAAEHYGRKLPCSLVASDSSREPEFD